MEIKWFQPDSADGERLLSQHAFKSKIRKRNYTGEEYEGCISLCGKISISSDGETSMALSMIKEEKVNSHACKKCLKIYNAKENFRKEEVSKKFK